MVMALSAPERESHKGGSSRVYTVKDIGGLVLFGDSASLKVDRVVTVKASRNFLGKSWVWEEVACQLLGGELIVGHILVKGIYDPLSPPPHIPMAIYMVAVCIGVACQVEPGQCHPLSIRRGCQ